MPRALREWEIGKLNVVAGKVMGCVKGREAVAGREHRPWCQEAAWSRPGRGQHVGAAGTQPGQREAEEEEGGTGWGWQGPEGELLRQSHS